MQPFSQHAPEDCAAASGPLPTVDRRWLLGMMAAYALLLLAFYPPIYTSIDEASAFSMAYVLRHGTIYPSHVRMFHDAEFFAGLSPSGPHGRVYRFPIGFPLLLAGLSWAGWRTFFLVNPLLHLTATWCFARILPLCRIPPRYAVLYLLLPSFVLFTRTLFSDAFAASLTTIGLYFLVCRRMPLATGLCLGLALTARSASVFVTLILLAAALGADWRRGDVPLWRGQAARIALGLAPFVLLNLVYNFYALGSPLTSAYNVQALSWQGLKQSGGIYALSLLLVYPALLLAPWLYRGPLWKEGLAATTLVFLVAAAYNESTYGNNFLQTLLSTPRQVLPVMPFYLLAYCGLAARLPWPAGRRRTVLEGLAAAALLLTAAIVSERHQAYLQSLRVLSAQISHALPPGSTVYANKDAYKLHQPIWDARPYRMLPVVSEAQCAADLKRGPVYAVLYVRSRGFAGEDELNAGVLRDLRARFLLQPASVSGAAQVQCYRVLGTTPRH